MKAHLMFEDADVNPEQIVPGGRQDVVQDLNLEIIVAAMANGDQFVAQVCEDALLTSLTEPATLRYRQEILSDGLAHPELFRQMYDIAVAAIDGERKVFAGFFRDSPERLLHRSVEVLELFLQPLQQLRTLAATNRDYITSAGLAQLFDSFETELGDAYFAEVANHLRQLKFKRGLLMSAELARGNKASNYVLRTPGNTKQSWKQWLGLEARTSFSFQIADRDEAGATALAELRDRGLNPVSNAMAQSTDHILSFFKMLRSEIGFYIGCLNLAETLQEKGQHIVMPEPCLWADRVLSATSLYDPSLALQTSNPIVGNDLSADNKSLIMITGANSGGKSTFLRSIGLAQLMMQCGMFVAATTFRGSTAAAVFTHFIREEDASMDSGRLDDELGRMNAIAGELTADSVVLFNESFSATNEREGSEIARQIIRALTEVGIRVVIVTHLYDLAAGFARKDGEDTLFLRAERSDDGTRTYQLDEAPPLATSFGEDIFMRLGSWGDPEPITAKTTASEAS